MLQKFSGRKLHDVLRFADVDTSLTINLGMLNVKRSCRDRTVDLYSLPMTCINLLLVSCVVPICWATLALRGVRYPGSGHDMLEAAESIVASLPAAPRRPREIPPHDADTHIQVKFV